MSQITSFVGGTGVGNVRFLTGDAGGLVGPDGGDNINLLSGADLTITGNPGANTLTITLDGTISNTYTTDSGNAVPAANILNVLGSHGLNSTGAGNTVTVLIDNAITLGDLAVLGAGVNAIQVDTGDIEVIAGNLEMPGTTSADVGVIKFGGDQFIHEYPSGSGNIFIGDITGNFTTTGIQNLAIGGDQMSSMTTAGLNVVVGRGTGASLTSGSQNTAIGYQALPANSTGQDNICMGNGALFNNLTGSFNICIGEESGFSYNSNESSNIILRYRGGPAGENNTIRIGNQGGGNRQQNRCFVAGIHNVTPTMTPKELVIIDTNGQLGSLNNGTDGQVIIGDSGGDAIFASLTSTDASITFVAGANTLDLSAASGGASSFPTDSGTATEAGGVLTVAGGSNINTSGAAATVTVNLDSTVSISGSMTAGTGFTATTGDVLISAGNLALPDTNAGLTEGVILFNSLRFISMFGTQNFFAGETAGNGTNTATDCTGIGFNALQALTSGNGNTIIGSTSGDVITDGFSNCSLGATSLSSLTTGDNNIAIGANALNAVVSGDNNVAVGSSCLSGITVGRSRNVGVGGGGVLAGVITGEDNTALGHFAGGSLTTSDSDNIMIKHNGVVGDNNTIRIGTQGSGQGQQDTTFIAGIDGVTPAGSPVENVIIDANGQLGSVVQSAFLGILTGQQANVTGDATVYTVPFDSEVFDLNSDFDITTGIFTAPITGKYFFAYSILFQGILNAHNFMQTRIVVSNRTILQNEMDLDPIATSSDLNVTGSMLLDMDATDTAKIDVIVSGSTLVIDIGADQPTFSGHLVF